MMNQPMTCPNPKHMEEVDFFAWMNIMPATGYEKWACIDCGCIFKWVNGSSEVLQEGR